MTAAKNAVFIGLWLESCYLVQRENLNFVRGGGGKQIKYWLGGSLLEGGEFF